MVVSGEEFLLKPSPEIYNLLLSRYGLKAEECIFIDDNPANVEGAKRVGMESIVFRGADTVLSDLEPYLSK
jgi:2-haloacid dehalogenase